jgi:hypothetical protein
MRRILILVGAVLVLTASASAAAAASTSAGVNVSRGQEDSMAYSLNILQKYEPWVDNENLEISPLAEIGGHLWVPEHDDKVWGGYLAPGLRVTLNTSSQIRPFLEGTVGGAVNSEDHLDDRDLGSNALFRTRGTVGVSFGDGHRHTLRGDYVHYSNWGLASKNDGYDTYGVSYGYSF